MKEQKFRRLLLVYATAFVVALTGLARATDRPNTDVTALATSDSIGDRILALEQARNDAIIHGDAATLDRLTSDDYTFINLRGAIQLKAEIVKGFASGAYRYESRQISELKVRVYGETAVLTGDPASEALKTVVTTVAIIVLRVCT